jgi:hypothetical protein
MNAYLDRFLEFLTDACAHYETSAPAVAAYLNNLYIRVRERPADVRLVEVLRAETLCDRQGWLGPGLAANVVYKLEHQLGRDVTGHAGF